MSRPERVSEGWQALGVGPQRKLSKGGSYETVCFGRCSRLSAHRSLLAAQAQAPAKRAAYIPPVKGVATIEVIQGPSKRVGKEMVTVLKIKNTSKGSINLLKIDEYLVTTRI